MSGLPSQIIYGIIDLFATDWKCHFYYVQKYFFVITPILFHMPALLLHVATSAIGHCICAQCKEANISFIVRNILKNKGGGYLMR